MTVFASIYSSAIDKGLKAILYKWYQHLSPLSVIDIILDIPYIYIT